MLLSGQCKTLLRNVAAQYKISSVKVSTVKTRSRVFSGIQPTGAPHLGNYFGAIRNWKKLQDDYSCVFSIVDLHSITLPQNPKELEQNIRIMAACLLACGIDPEKSVFFLQSEVAYHAELAWILGCFTTMARLSQLPQYKEKCDENKSVPLGLYLYPLLQSADILLYKATHVPVGEDQVQHIQLSRHLAHIFNERYKKDVFPVPEAVIDSNCARIKSLQNPEKKMSKSDVNVKSRIELTDSTDTIRMHIKKGITDFTSVLTYDPENRPGVSNLILIHSLCSGISPSDICEQNKSLDTGQYKMIVADAVIEHLKPIQSKIKDYLADSCYISRILKSGSDKASQIAFETLKDVKAAVGLSYNSIK